MIVNTFSTAVDKFQLTIQNSNDTAVKKLNMDLNRCLLIPIILLASLSIYPANASNLDLNSGYVKQHRLFSKLSNNWDDSDAYSQDDVDESSGRATAGRLFLEHILKQRQRPLMLDSEYSQLTDEMDGGGDVIDSSFPYGIQNVYNSAAGRPTRSKNRHKSTFQSLCPTKRETVFLNLDPDYEYRPEYYDEVRCVNVPNENRYQSAVCSEAGFSCIQLNGTIFLTRRARGDSCWESETRTISSGCECMWPKHQLGDIMAHH